MLRSVVAGVVSASALLLAPQALAQFRESAPAVLPKAAVSDPDAGANRVLNQFVAWNRTAGRPAFLVFWNRALTDETATRETQRVVETADGRSGATSTTDTTNTQFGSASRTNEDTIDSRRRETVSAGKITTGGTYAAIDPLASRVLETTFVNFFLQSGAQVVDRDVLLRRTSVDLSAPDRADLQFVESKALSSGIIYLIEVLPDKNSGGPTGTLFSVSIKHLPSATLVGQFITAGAVPPGPSRIQATSKGFERVTQDRTTPERIAAQVATETMARLLAASAR